jgi:hypothetical protein
MAEMFQVIPGSMMSHASMCSGAFGCTWCLRVKPPRPGRRKASSRGSWISLRGQESLPEWHDLQRRLRSLKIPKTLDPLTSLTSLTPRPMTYQDLLHSSDSSGLGLRIPAFTYQIHISLDKEPSYFHRRRSLVTMTFRRPRPLALRLCRPPSHRKRSNHSRPSCIV